MEAQNGLSLFKDSNSMFLNNSLLLRQEEEDALEEERQQNENILKKLSEAFDITSDDEDDDDDDDDDEDDEDDDECSNTSRQSHVTDKSTSYEDKSNTKTCASKSSHRKAVESKQGHHKMKTISCSSRNESNRIHRKHNLSSVYEDESDISYEATQQSKRATQLSNKATQQNNKATQQSNIATQQSNRRSVSPHYKHCTQSINNSVAKSSSRSPAIDKSNSVANSSPDALQNNSEDASQNEAYLKSRYQSMDQLSVLYDVRLRELEKLKNSLSQEQQKCNMLERKIMILESEKSGAELSYRQTQELLVSSKQQISALEEQIKELRNGLANLEKSKTQNESELITSRDIINDLQARIRFLENNDPSLAAVKQMESTIKSLQNQHMQEVASLQLQLKNKTAKLEEKEDSLKSMEGRVLDLETKLTTTLVEKSDALNSVMRDLEVSQRQFRELMASCDVTRHQSQSCDVTRLQSQLQDALAQNKELSRTLSKRDAECNSLRADLEQAETFSKLALDSFDDSTMHLGKVTRPTCDAAMIQADNCNKLKSELHRALQDKRAKRQEIKELRQTLDSRNSRIRQMEQHEGAYKAEVERLKVNMLKLTEEVDRKCKDSLDSNNKSCILKTEKEVQCNIAVDVDTNQLENLNKQLSRAEDEIVFLKKEIDSREVELKTMKRVLDESKRHSGDGDSSIDLTIERMKINEKKMKQELESKIIELRVTMEQKDKECDDLKKMYIELKAAKENAIKTMESNNNTRISKLMTDLDCTTSKLKEMEIHAQEIKNKYETTLEENHQLSSNLDEVTDLFMQLVSKLKPDQISSDTNVTKLKSIAELKEIASEIIFGDKDSNNDTLKKEYELMIREKEKEIGNLRSLLDSKEKHSADALALAKKTETESVADVMNQCNTDSSNCSDLEVISAKYEEKLRLLQNEHASQTKRLEQDYNNKISAIEKSHSEIITAIKNEIEAKMKEVEEREKYIINDFQQRLIDQENNLKSKYLADLNAAEETAKTLTIQHFASEVKKIEEYYQKEYESSRTKMEQAAINSINTLKRVIAEKEKEIFDLKSMNLKSSNEKVSMLEKKSEEDRMKLIILTKQVTEMQEELSSKQKSINKLSVELNDAVREKRELNYRIEVVKNRSNEVIKSQFTKVLNRLQLQIDENLFKGTNEYDRKIQEVEEIYTARENEMKKRDRS